VKSNDGQKPQLEPAPFRAVVWTPAKGIHVVTEAPVPGKGEYAGEWAIYGNKRWTIDETGKLKAVR
jgi:hypothetical protein